MSMTQAIEDGRALKEGRSGQIARRASPVAMARTWGFLVGSSWPHMVSGDTLTPSQPARRYRVARIALQQSGGSELYAC